MRLSRRYLLDKDELEAYRRPLPLLMQYLLDHHQLYSAKVKKGETLHRRLTGDRREVGRGRHNLLCSTQFPLISLVRAHYSGSSSSLNSNTSYRKAS